MGSLKRHFGGDWGDLDAEDRKANKEALVTGERLFSVYKHPSLPKIWIITDAEVEGKREVTTVLFPEEY